MICRILPISEVSVLILKFSLSDSQSLSQHTSGQWVESAKGHIVIWCQGNLPHSESWEFSSN